MEGLKLLSKIALKKWNTNFRLEHSERKKQDYLFGNSVAPGNFQLDETKNSVSFTFQLDFPEPELSFC